MRKRQVQAIGPAIDVRDRDEKKEIEAFERVLRVVEQFTPLFEVQEAGVCSFALLGPARYFGGEQRLLSRVLAAVKDVVGEGVDVRLGVADTHFAANLAADDGFRGAFPWECVVEDGFDPGECCVVQPAKTAEFLSPLPVAVLEMEALVSVLARLGITSLGALASLSVSDVLGRFSNEGVLAHRHASGFEVRSLDAVEIDEPMSVAQTFEPALMDISQIAFIARRIALLIEGKLRRRGVACSSIRIEAESEHGETLERTWYDANGFTAGAMTDRVRWHLEAWLTSDYAKRPTGGLSRLCLLPGSFKPASGGQMGFWGGERDSDRRLERAIARLGALVGADGVKVASWRGGRNPEDEGLWSAAGSLESVENGRSDFATWSGRLPSPSPVELFEGRAILLQDRSGGEVMVSARGELSAPLGRWSRDGHHWYAITLWAGPWPVEERWWDEGRARRRVRFQVVDENDHAWLFNLERGSWWLAGKY